MSDDGLVLFGRLCAQFGKASREGSCEYLDSDEIYLIRGDELRREAEEWDEGDEFFDDYSLDELDDEGIYIWGNFVMGAFYSPEALALEEWPGRVTREDLDCIRHAAFTPEARKLEERALSAYRALEGGTDAIQRI